MYKTYGTGNYNYIKDTIEAIREKFDKVKNHSLHSKYDKDIGVFPCRTLNLAKQLGSMPYTNHSNLA
jgi:hypothetical protein